MKDWEKEELKEELENCQTFYDILVLINRKYDLKKAKIDWLTRNKIVNGVIEAIKFTKPPKKE